MELDEVALDSALVRCFPLASPGLHLGFHEYIWRKRLGLEDFTSHRRGIVALEPLCDPAAVVGVSISRKDWVNEARRCDGTYEGFWATLVTLIEANIADELHFC